MDQHPGNAWPVPLPPAPRRRFGRPQRFALVGAVVVALAIGISGAQAATTAPTLPAGTQTLWGSGRPLTAAVDSDTNSVEVGQMFTPTVSGSVLGVKFWKTPQNSGTHVGNLWSKDGRKLATVTFTGETSQGWQFASFSAPVAVTAGSQYVVSYLAPKGRYATTENFTGVPSAPQMTIPRANSGVYAYGARSSFPRAVWHGSVYWVDAVFRPGGSAPSPSATATPTAHPSPSATATRPSQPSPSATSQPSPSATSQPSPSASATPTTKPRPAPTASQPTQSSPSTTAPPPATTPPSSATSFPTAATTGLPAGWTPKKQVTGDYWVKTAGAVVEDLRVTNGTIYVDAPNVTLRRVEGVNAMVINDYNDVCKNGLVIADSYFHRTDKTSDQDLFVIGPGGYTLQNVKIEGVPEGPRVAGKSEGCGTVTFQDTYIEVASPDVCNDWHGDGIQGYDGPPVVVRNTTVIMNETRNCGGTAPFFYPVNQGNTSVDIDGLLLSGGGYSLRDGMPGAIRNVYIEDRAWGYGPVSVRCSAVTTWQVWTAALGSNGQPILPGKPVTCTGDGV